MSDKNKKILEAILLVVSILLTAIQASAKEMPSGSGDKLERHFD